MINLYTCTLKFPTSSFTLQVKEISEGMKNLGIENELLDIYQSGLMKGDNYFHPFHYRQQWDFENATLFGVADTDSFNQEYLQKLRETPYKNFVVSSEYAKGIFGLKNTKVVGNVIPYFAETYSKEIKKKVNDVPVFYINASHSWHRRGTDIAIKALDEIAKSGYKFRAILRVWNPADIDVERKWLKVVSGFLTEKEHYDYIAKSDYFLHPVRGGNFEISILEAIIFGSTPIITDAPPFNEVPINRKDVYYISSVHTVTGWQNLWHTGQMWEVDVNNTVNVIERALSKGTIKVDPEPYYKKYGRETIAGQLAEIISS